jgi:Carboxypeptidase regulatory-like domain
MTVRRAILALAAPLALVSCGDTPVNGPGGPGLASLSIHAVAPPALSTFGLNLAVEQVSALLYKVLPSQSVDTVAVRTVPFPATSNTLNLGFTVLVGSAPETLTVQLDYQTAGGRSLFVASEQVIAQAGTPAVSQPLQPAYVGPGSNVAVITIQPRNASVIAGQTTVFGFTALDSLQAPADSVYVSWSASAGAIGAFGNFQAPGTPGNVMIRARSPNGTQDSVSVSVLAPGAGVIAGQVVDGATGAPLANATVTVFDALNNLVATVQTATDGSYVTSALPPGLYRIDVSLNGFTSTSLFDAALGGGGTNTVAIIPLAPASASLGDVGGVVKDASTNSPIAGALVELRAGVNATTGTSIASTTSDSVGGYQFVRQAAGTYTVGASATGYANGYRTSVILGGGASTGDDVVLSPVGAGIVQVVLQWGATPPDLDAHMTGPDSTTGTRFHVYYGDPGSLTTRPYASLDVDNTNGFGPETITLSQEFPGVYRYSVHDYTNSGDTTSAQFLAASGARVDLYINGLLARQFFVPNAPGTLWTVFELNGTTITPINTMSFVANSGDVTLRQEGGTDGTDGEVIGRDTRRHPKR